MIETGNLAPTDFDLVIGLEVHAQLMTQTKLFSPAANAFGHQANENIAPVCLALPGSLPVLNQEAIALAARAGFALGCDVKAYSVFSRKNYFYPDLPKGYQISQFDKPLCEGGFLDIQLKNKKKRIKITRIHVEEDAGKLIHQGADAIKGASHSCVDLNRAGVPLIEIVSEPDMTSFEEARAYVETLREILIHLDVCDGNMQEGSLRCDANISLKPKGSKTLGTRTEIKNLNSYRSLERALKAEYKRQAGILASGGSILQETRNYDDQSQQTTSLRSKEDAHDYRYFPEPDLPPLILSKETLYAWKESLPELPKQKRERYKNDLMISENDCDILMQDRLLDRFFETCLNHNNTLKQKVPAKKISNWLVGECSKQLNENEININQSALSAKNLLLILNALEDKKITQNIAKTLLSKALNEDVSLTADIEKESKQQLSNEDELEALIYKLLEKDPDANQKLKSGDKKIANKVSNFIMGMVMKETQGKANPASIQTILKKIQSA